jgi:hypothetical protein
VIKAISADGSDQPFSESILPGRSNPKSGDRVCP